MKKNTNKPIALIFLILLSTSIFANKTPNYPKGFSPKTNSGISFTENKGQIHDQNYKSRPDVLFGGSDGNLVFHLKNNGISYQLNRVDTWKKEEDISTKKAGFENAEAQTKLVADQTTIYRLDINWLNANTNAELIKQKPLDGFNNYYLENCPNGALNVKSYQQITYQNIYEGIDLKWYEKDGRLEYDYLVSAGADYKQIQLEIKGADKITLNNKGELIYKTPLGDIIEQAPLVKQNGNTLKSRWIITNNVLSFEIENINKNEAFIIDPLVRLWGTYYGGSGDDYGYSCTTDANGNVYMAGTTRTTSGTSIASMGSHQSAFGGSITDAFLVKFNSAGIRQWGTYYGGIGNDNGNSCATDNSGNVYMAGRTDSNSGIATAGSHQSFFAGSNDAFLVKFNSAGVRQWGTYYGGIDIDRGNSCSTDASGNVYMAGYTRSTSNIATLGSHQTVYNNFYGNGDAFLVKFNSSGIRQWGTLYGGAAPEEGFSCSTDGSGNVYMAGNSADNGITVIGNQYVPNPTAIATSGSHQSTNGGGSSYDGFLVKFNSAGIRQWGTFYGGSGDDFGYSCATDASGNVYMAGYTASSSGTRIATVGSHQSAFGGNVDDAFLVKFNSAGSRQWGTYYGGSGFDYGYSCATDASGNIYMAGSTSSTLNIGTVGSHQSNYGGGSYHAFLVKFNSAGIRQWGTYYGATGAEMGSSCATYGSGIVYIAGYTNTNSGTDISSLGSHQSAYGGGNWDAFLVKFNECPIISVNSGTICVGQSFTINPTGADTYTIQGANTVVNPSINTTYTVIGTNTLSGCVSQAIATISLIVNPNPTITVNNGTICAGQNFTINPNGANTYTIQGANAVVSPPSNTSYTVAGTSTAGCLSQAFATSNLIVNPNPTITVNSGTICAGQNFTINPNGSNTYTIQGGNAVVSPPSNASYTVIGTNTAGCVSQATSNLIVYPNPIITVNSGAICAGQNFTINPNGANTYTIQGANAVVSPASNTSYTVAGTSTSGCVSQAVATSNLIVNANPTITVNSGAICVGQNFTINPNGANTYTIQGGNAVVSPASNTSYTVAGTSAAGCVSQAFATTNLTVNPNPTITVNNGTICAGQNFTINPNGANTYTIQGGNAVVSPASNTSFTVAGTSAAGCISLAFATSNLSVNASPILSISGNTSICIFETTTLVVSGGNTYQWSNGVSSNSIVVYQSISSSNYTVTSTFTNGCSSSATIQVLRIECTGISELNNQNGIKIYPNPNNGEFTVELLSTNNTYITITNVLGQIIKTQKAELTNKININAFDKGVYFISVMDNNQSVYRGSMIKE